MTQDLKDHVLIKRTTALGLLYLFNELDSLDLSEETVEFHQALKQDLSGMVVVPALPHEKNFKYSPWYCIANEMTYRLTMGRRAGSEELYRTAEVIYNMLSAAQKEKNDG